MTNISKHAFINLAGFAAVLVSFLLPGCSDEDRSIPRSFTIVGEALGQLDTLTIDCECFLIVELDEKPGSGFGEFTGTHGGSFRRTVLNPDGSGISLEPDVFGDVILRLYKPDSLEVIFPANEGSESSFWRNVARFPGRRGSGEHGAGEWTCAPFDIWEGGWVDTVGIAVGSWRIEER